MSDYYVGISFLIEISSDRNGKRTIEDHSSELRRCPEMERSRRMGILIEGSTEHRTGLSRRVAGSEAVRFAKTKVAFESMGWAGK
jgi:hypothetical protein